VLAETFEVLRSLGHSDTEARRLVDGLREGKKKYKDVQESLEAIYRQMHRGR
jgi:Holliday junction DNA helicase RuvA